ncbi:MAG: MFS transporter [Acidobacteriota bacterium]|nr:MFS transporter [Acidobacteriota bacterium]
MIIASRTSSNRASGIAAVSTARLWTIIAILSLGAVIAYVARVNLSVAVVMPEFKKLFHLTDADRGLLNSAFFWSYAFLQIPAGLLVDRYGVKIPYAIGFLTWSLISAVTGFAGTFSQLVILRVLLGVFESVGQPASLRWIRFHFPERQRGLAVGLFMTGTKIGPAIGTPLAAVLIKAYGWHVMFFVLGLGSLLWLIPWLGLVRNDDRRMELASANASAVSVSFAQTMGNPIIWGTIVGTFCYMYFVYFCMTWMPAYFVERRHLALSSMGLYTFFSFGGMAAVAPLAGWAADWIIARGNDAVRVRRGFVIAGFLIASTEVFGALSSSTSVALFFAVFSLTGLGLATANYWAITQTLMPGGAIGRIVGIQNCAASLPGIVAPIITGWLVQRTGDYRAPMQAIWCFLILGIAAYCFLVRAKYAPKTGLNGSVNLI